MWYLEWCHEGRVSMRLREDIRPVTYMKTRAAELLKQVGESRRPVVITQRGEAKAVVLDVDTYEALRDATLLLQLAAQGESDLQAGRVLTQDQAFKRVRARLSAR
jgi:prevent-host-death family protein